MSFMAKVSDPRDRHHQTPFTVDSTAFEASVIHSHRTQALNRNLKDLVPRCARLPVALAGQCGRDTVNRLACSSPRPESPFLWRLLLVRLPPFFFSRALHPYHGFWTPFTLHPHPNCEKLPMTIHG